MGLEDPTPRPDAPGSPPPPATPDRPHGDPLAPEVPTDPPVQPDDDPTVDRRHAPATGRKVAVR